MKNNNTAITTSATATATALWTCHESTHALTLEIATLCQASGNRFKDAGEALATAWHDIGGDMIPAQSTRFLVEACFGTTMEKKEASKFLNGMALVSKQRISQLLAVVYDGDKEKNKGKAKDKGESESESEESQDGLDKSGSGFTFEQILAAIGTLKSISKEQAQAAAIALAAKIA